MNVVNLEVSAGLDAIVIVLTLLSLLGIAMLMLLAWANVASRNRAFANELLPVTLSRTLRVVQLNRAQLSRACAASRAPPCCFPADQSLRASARL